MQIRQFYTHRSLNNNKNIFFFPARNFSISFDFVPISIAYILFDFNLVTFWLKARLNCQTCINTSFSLCRQCRNVVCVFIYVLNFWKLIAANDCCRAINAATHSNNAKLPNIYISLCVRLWVRVSRQFKLETKWKSSYLAHISTHLSSNNRK